MRFGIADLPDEDYVRAIVRSEAQPILTRQQVVLALTPHLEVWRAACQPHDGMPYDEAHKRACAWPLIVGDVMLELEQVRLTHA